MTAVLILLSGLSSLILGLLCLRRKNPVTITYSLFAFIVSAWIGVNFIFQISKDASYVKSLYALGALAVGSGVIFALYFLFKGIKTIYVALVAFFALLAFVVSIFSNYVVSDVKEIFSTGYIAVTGQLFLWYSLYIVIGVCAFFILMFSQRKKASGVRLYQINYIILGFCAFGGITALVSFILPLFNVWKVTSLDSPSALFFVISSFYAITKHRLLDIRLIVLRTLSYSLVVLLIGSTVVLLTLSLTQISGLQLITKIFISVLASIFIVLVLDPLKKWVAQLTDKLFYKAQVNYPILLTELSEIINREIDLDVLLFSLAHKLEKNLKIKNSSIYIASTAGGAYFKRKGRVDSKGKKVSQEEIEKMEGVDMEVTEDKLSHSNPLISYLRKEKQIIVLEALERKIEDTQDEKERKKLEASKEALDGMDAAVVAPILVSNNLNAVMVLGPKLSGDPYGTEDLQLLSLLGPQLASALDKSRLYEEIKQFSERLKKEIAIATEDVRNTNLQLNERNRYLTALQNVTNLITKTLDFRKVTQSIADSIHSELGYMGGILLLLGKDRHKLFPDAVTSGLMTPEVQKLLGKPLTDLYGDFRTSDSRTAKAIKTGQVQIGTSFAEFFAPALPPAVCDKIQEIMKIRTIIAVPIYSEDGIVGAIDFIVQKDPGELKDTDLNIMRALCNQTGIVYRNIELYRQLSESNKELAEANVHLQQLDQAKSEFVSIASHQLRTPMTGIMGYLSMILQSDFGKVPQKQADVIAMLLEESQRMIRLINLFLNVSKIESGKMELLKRPTDIHDVIEKVMTVVRKSAEDKKLKLSYTKPKSKLPLIMADQDKLGDVVLNLVDNAIKYTDTGSIAVSVEQEKDKLHVRVKDTGRGIPTGEASKLFAKFVRGYGIAQVNPDGSGLGLYVARRLVEAHGGDIWVESDGPGKGSTFQFTLPVAKDVKKEGGMEYDL